MDRYHGKDCPCYLSNHKQSNDYSDIDNIIITVSFLFEVAEHLTAQHNAVKMLHSRVKLILDYVKAVQAGELPMNHEILRDANSLCHRLPVLHLDKFDADFYNVS